MNFYNPYLYNIPTKTGIGSIFSKINLSSIINGTSKTLNLINQAIPVIRQVSPIINNAKTMFKVMNEFKKTDVKSENRNNINNTIDNTEVINNEIYNDNGPTFFV